MDTTTTRRRLLTALAAAGAAGATAPAAAARQAGGRWPYSNYDPQNTGAKPAGDGPSTAVGTGWSANFGQFDVTPSLTAGRVYLTDAANNEVLAIERDDGTVTWRADADVYGGQVGAVGETVYVPDESALVARAAADGTERWRVGYDSRVHAARRVGNEVYVGGRMGVAKMSADGNPRWHNPGPSLYGTAPVVGPEQVFTADSRNGTVLAHGKGEGTEGWLRRNEGAAEGSPALSDGRLFVPLTDTLVAITTEGVREWEASLTARGSPTVADGTVYVGTGDAVVAVDAATGERTWRQNAVGTTNATALVGDRLFVAGDDGVLAALLPGSGTVRWRVPVGGTLDAGPAVAGGELYLGDREGRLRQFTPGARTPAGGTDTATDARTATPSEAGADATDTATPASSPGLGVGAGVAAVALAAWRRVADR
jgi:hypothetical protein